MNENEVIKFKAFDLTDKKVYDVQDIYFYEKPDAAGMLGEVTYKGFTYSCYFGKGDLEQCKLMRYTGINSIAEEPIFEGQIIRLKGFDPEIYQVIFDRGAFCFLRDKEKDFPIDCKYLEKCTVIGNIYENPNLLKDE